MRKKIEIKPEYQREGKIWDEDKQKEFLDSIFNGYDIPKIYFHALNKPKKKSGVYKIYSIIDGRQRLEALWNFIDNKITLGDYPITRLKDPIILNSVSYSQLGKKSLKLKSYFDNYPLPIMLIKLADEKHDDLINEMFLRLNSGVVLSSAEKRNAIGGKMARLIRDMAKHEFFKDHIAMSNKRYRHYEMIVRLLFLENSIRKNENPKVPSPKKKFLDKFVKEYKEKLPDDGTIEMLESVLYSMTKIFSVHDKLLTKQAKIPIYYLLVREAKQQNKIKNITREKIDEFNLKVEENKRIARERGESSSSLDHELWKYERATIQGTNDPGSIKERFRIIAKKFDVDSSAIYNL